MTKLFITTITYTISVISKNDLNIQTHPMNMCFKK